MGFQIVMLLAAGLMFGAETTPAAEAKNVDAMQGAWRLIRGEANGNPLTQAELKDGKLEINGDHYTVTLAEIGKLQGTQKLGEKEGVKTIDATDDQNVTCLGIYEINGDEYRVILAPPGEDRPSKFETTPNSGQWMHVWSRVK